MGAPQASGETVLYRPCLLEPHVAGRLGEKAESLVTVLSLGERALPPLPLMSVETAAPDEKVDAA